MNKISLSTKILLLFAVISTMIQLLKDSDIKFGAKMWYNRLQKPALELWKSMQKNTQKESGDCNFAFDELEAFTYEIIQNAFSIDIDDIEDYIEHIKSFKNERKNTERSS
jgi:hypothetical protein